MIFECQSENDNKVSFQPLLVQNLIKKQTKQTNKTKQNEETNIVNILV